MVLKINSLKKTNEWRKLATMISEQAIVSFATFLISATIAKVYDKMDYANFVLLSSIAMSILGFQRAIITQPFVINYLDYTRLEKIKYYRFTIKSKIIFNFVLLFLLPILLFFLEFESKTFVIYIISFTSYFFVKDILIGLRQTRFTLYIGITVSAMLMLALFISRFGNILDFNLLILIISLIYFSVFLFLAIKTKRNKKSHHLSKNMFVLDNWRIGKWILGSSLLYSLYAQATPWIILGILTRVEVATYGILVTVTSLINPIMASVNSYLLPLFTTYKEKHQILKERFIYWQIVFVFSGLALAIFGVVFGEVLVVLVFGSKYNNMGWLVILPFFNQAISVCFQPVDILLNAIKRTDVVFYIAFFRMCLSLILLYFLIRKYGLMGVFVAKIIENLIYQVLIFCRTIKILQNAETPITKNCITD
jgi:O-antigen/teichoic acid export membrane protein